MLKQILVFAILFFSMNVHADHSNYSKAVQALRDIRNSSQDVKKWANDGRDRAVCLFESTISRSIYQFGFEAQTWVLEQNIKNLDIQDSEQRLHAYENLIMAFCQADISRNSIDYSTAATGLKVPTSLAQVSELLDRMLVEVNNLAKQMGATL